MTGSAGSAPGMTAVGGAFGGDWNANGGVSPADAHWPPRTPTWIRVDAGAKAAPDAAASCTGFLTLLLPRNASTAAVRLEVVQEFGDGAVTIESSGATGSTVYFLGDRPRAAGNKIGELRGLAAVVGHRGEVQVLDHVALIQGSVLDVPQVRQTPWKLAQKLGQPQPLIALLPRE